MLITLPVELILPLEHCTFTKWNEWMIDLKACGLGVGKEELMLSVKNVVGF